MQQHALGRRQQKTQQRPPQEPQLRIKCNHAVRTSEYAEALRKEKRVESLVRGKPHGVNLAGSVREVFHSDGAFSTELHLN